jgi:hypothetical protein
MTTKPAARKTTAPSKPTQAEETVTVHVTPGYLVYHDGEQRGGTLRVPADVAAQWVARGWATV